jgi:alanine racemase
MTVAIPMTSWIEISEERLAANFRAIAQAAGRETVVLAVVKANAYGHGIELCSPALARAGAPWLGVTGASEGARARHALAEAGIAPKDQPRILVMCGFLPQNVEAIAEHALTPVVWTPQQVGWLQGSGTAVHVEIDTGMARQGVHPGAELEDLLAEIEAAELPLDGLLTHFCAAEAAHSELTQTQQRRFESAIAQVRRQGLAPKWVHAGSSSSVDNPAQSSPWLVDLANSVGARAMVRCGIALYGYCSPITGADAASVPSKLRPALRPVMTWKTRVLSLRDLAAGETVGYNATFTAPAPMRLAMLPVGYADGLRRELSGSDARPGGWVIIPSRDGSGPQAETQPAKAEPQAASKAPIVGRVSMNLTMVDITAIPGVRVGDEVVVLGDGITADDHARLAQTIPYEILCAVRVG